MVSSKPPQSLDIPADLGFEEGWDELNQEEDPWGDLVGRTDPQIHKYMQGVREERERVALMVLRTFGHGTGAELFAFIRAMYNAKPRGTYDEVLRRDGVMDFIEWVEQHMRVARNL